MRADYDVLKREIGSSQDFADLQGVFIDGGHNGVYIRVPRGLELDDVDFLERLPGLKYVEVDGAVRDDSRAFSLPEVEELTLLTGSQVPFRASASDTLTSLGIDDRPGVLDLSAYTGLQNLTVWSFARKELDFLSGAPHLRWLKVEGMGQAVNLEGIGKCRSLLEVELLEIHAESLAPLRSVRDLLRLWIIGPAKPQGSSNLDLGELSGMRSLRELRITNSGAVYSVEPLLGLSDLQDVRLRGTRVLEPSAEVLQRLSRRARVVGPDE
ncbi:hypothetical protein [Actinoplanes sp. NBRC 103695]|uniref:hypothetical protein n=1 Tax=Actinoplanes sp. NBRC 103695 TaxID=3032202 RepID=UPI0025533FA8|nr:hypothetical protein [Actinoplanes sp. NBRC 103695]